MYRLDFTILREILPLIYTLNRRQGIFVGACKLMYAENEIITPNQPHSLENQNLI